MATIDSLDLASLQNNPQSIAEALEDVLETTNGTIGSLKTSAQEDHDAIEALKTSAQEDHDAIEDFLDITNIKSEKYTSLSSSWAPWDIQGDTTQESGVRVQNMGRLWIMNMSIEKNIGSTGNSYDMLLDISNEFTSPGDTVYLGMQHFGHSYDSDFTGLIELHSDGKIYLYYNNTLGNYHVLVGNFIGLDTSS